MKLRLFFENGFDTNRINRYKNSFDYMRWAKKNPVLHECVSSNRRFKNIHNGDRCFILGNGPSLKDVDFELLKGEILFGVNHCMLSPLLDKVELAYWLCLDGAFFISRRVYNKQKETIANMSKLSLMENVQCFVPIEHRDFIRGMRIDQEVNINYCGPIRLSMTDANSKEECDFDISKFRYMSYSIVIDAVTMAIYMGFSEIYLLGCDASVIKSRIDAFMGNDMLTPLHFYSDKKDIDDFVDLMHYHGILHELKTEYNCFSNWNYVCKYCWEHSIKLYNLSSHSLLDFIPKKRLEDII